MKRNIYLARDGMLCKCAKYIYTHVKYIHDKVYIVLCGSLNLNSSLTTRNVLSNGRATRD